MLRVLLSVLFLLLLAPAPATALQPLVFSIAPAQPVMAGAAVLKAAYARMGIPVLFKDYPARRGLAEANEGIADGEVSRMGGLGSELSNLIQINPPVSEVQGVAVTCNPDLTIRNRNDLVGLRVGVHPGIRVSEKLVEGLADVTVGPWSHLFKMLYLDRLDVIIAYDGIEQTQRGRAGSERLRVIRPTIWKIPLHHYLNRRHADLIPKLTEVIHAMQASGELERIRDSVLLTAKP